VNRLMVRLGAQFDELSSSYESILNRCEAEGRDPNEVETSTLEGLRSEMAPLAERLTELRETDDRRAAASRAMTDAPELPAAGERTPVVSVRSAEQIYRPDGETAFFGDLYRSQKMGDTAALERLDRHDQIMRAATTGLAPGVVPPTWLFEEFAALAHGARPTADTLRRIPIANANPVTIGIQTVGAIVGAQAAENNPPADGDFRATPLVVTPTTLTGKVDASRQLLDGSNPAVDGIIYGDCMGAYAEQVETLVWAALTALTPAQIAGVFPVDVTSDPPGSIPDAVIDAGTAVNSQRHASPNVLFCSHAMWGEISKQKDLQGRPLVVSGYHGPSNAYGLGDAVTYGQVAGELVGLAVVPSWAGTAAMYVVRAADSVLLESSTMNFRFEEVIGPQSIRLGVWGYAGVTLMRYPKGIARIPVTSAAGSADDGETRSSKK
jgi:HK97 family phage major capsid protein